MESRPFQAFGAGQRESPAGSDPGMFPGGGTRGGFPESLPCPAFPPRPGKGAQGNGRAKENREENWENWEKNQGKRGGRNQEINRENRGEKREEKRGGNRKNREKNRENGENQGINRE